MSKTLKQLLSALLAILMITVAFASCAPAGDDDGDGLSDDVQDAIQNEEEDDENEGEDVVVEEDPNETPDAALLAALETAKKGTYTFNSYTSALGTNWNPHTWENSADSAVLGYIETPLADLTAKNTNKGEYQWIFLAATDIQDVTAANQADLVKYGIANTEATKDYVFEIKLRPEMVWEDGTPINADTYIYSMKALLDPTMKNYRAGNYISGESALVGALAYYNQGAPIYAAVVPAYGEGETPDYSLDLSAWDLYIDLKTTGMTFAGYSFYEICYDYGYISEETYKAVDAEGATNIYGMTKITEENQAAVLQMMDEYCSAFGISIFNEDGSVNEEFYKEFLFYDTKEVGAAVDFDAVGLYKVDEYTIRYVCATAYDYYYFLTSCTSNWIVHETLYEACKKTDPDTGLITSTYGTSKETTMSYGPYRIDYLQDEKQMIYVQNAKYFEYNVDAETGLIYSATNKANHLEVAEDGTKTSVAGFKVNGTFQPQYSTQKIVIDVMNDDAAKLAFLKGDLDEWTPAADEVVNYTTSDQLYQVDETYTMRLFFHTDLAALQNMDQSGNQNSVVMSSENFRKALSLSIKRNEFVTATAGYKAAYYLINSLYFYDVYEDPSSIYRNTEQAMQAVCNIYGVKYGAGEVYETLEDAYYSVTGYNLSEAKTLMKAACDELVAAGLYTAGQPIKIQMAWKAGAMDSSDQKQVTLLNQYVNAAAEGSGFGAIELVAVDNLSQRYKDVANGLYAIGYGAWGGAAFYPFTMFRVYCDAEYAGYLHEAGCWDPAVETLTLTINGEEVTMTWYEWSNSMTGEGKYADASNETKLAVLAAIEENFIEKYYCIPLCTTTACYMLSYKTTYFTEQYNIMYGFGGMRLMKYNYTDTEWAAFIANGLTY